MRRSIYQSSGLKASGADTLFHASSARFAAQAIRKAQELSWNVQHVLLSGVSGISAVLRPAGLVASTGAITALWLKSSEDPMWDGDAGYEAVSGLYEGVGTERGARRRGFPIFDRSDDLEILKRCGDDLSRGESHQAGNEYSGNSTADVPARRDNKRQPIEPDCLEKGQDGTFRRHPMGAVR